MVATKTPTVIRIDHMFFPVVVADCIVLTIAAVFVG